MKLFAAALALSLSLPAASVGQADRAKMMGNPNAPVRLDVYSDFQCPACKGFHETVLPQLLRDYVTPGKVYIVNHEFPLAMHPYSRVAANFATAAARIGKYRVVADALFRDQNVWSINGRVWDTVAKVLTPTEQKKVQELAKDPSVLSEVQADVNQGNAEHVNETPTLFIVKGSRKNAWPGPNLSNYPIMRSLLDGLVK